MSEALARSQKLATTRAEDPVVYIKKLYVRFLRGLFNFNPAGCFHWEPDKEITEIVIVAEAPLDMSVVGKRPCITVVMGPYQYQGLAINNMLKFNLTTEERTRTDLMSGHLVVYCLAENDIIAQRLAHLVIHGTRVNQGLLEGVGGFHQIARPTPSANSPSPPAGLVPGDPSGLVMVQANIAFSFQWTWTTRPKAPASARSLNMITEHRRASDFPYTSPSELERVQLAMSTTPVLVRGLSGGGVITTVTVRDGMENFQTVITVKSTDELPQSSD